MIEAATREPPFGFLDDEAVRSNIRQGILPDPPKELSDEARLLEKSIAERDLSARISFGDWRSRKWQ